MRVSSTGRYTANRRTDRRSGTRDRSPGSLARCACGWPASRAKPAAKAIRWVDTKPAQIQTLAAKSLRLWACIVRPRVHGTVHSADENRTIQARDTENGTVGGMTAELHTSTAFVAFLKDIVVSQPMQREIHIIVDNIPGRRPGG